VYYVIKEQLTREYPYLGRQNNIRVRQETAKETFPVRTQNEQQERNNLAAMLTVVVVIDSEPYNGVAMGGLTDQSQQAAADKHAKPQFFTRSTSSIVLSNFTPPALFLRATLTADPTGNCSILLFSIFSTLNVGGQFRAERIRRIHGTQAPT
jgi:hypothetical protein